VVPDVSEPGGILVVDGPLAVLAGGFLVRVFIISHDCGHGSFLPSAKGKCPAGQHHGGADFHALLSLALEHSVHHATSANLDRRGTGDVWTMTVQEYLESSRWQRFAYRLARNPIILFGIAPLFLFLIKMRFPAVKAGRRERHSVAWTNLALVVMASGLCWAFGWQAYLLVQLIILTVAGSVGVWLFYVQHQFEGVYWQRKADWDYATAALQGSSFYKLPRVLQWFSGNIGFHHVHHLSPRIPNYHLEKCHRAEPLFQSVKPVTLFASFKSFTFRLWDEQRQRLVATAPESDRKQNARAAMAR